MRCPACGFDAGHNSKPRSVEQIRRHFGIIRAAFIHWPETHPRQFSDAEECRAWLQMKAGAREVGAQIPLTGMSKERAMMLAEAAIRGSGSYAMPVIHGDTLVVFKPRSIAFAKMPHAEFCALTDAVADVIRAETGMDPEILLRETEAAA